MWRWCGEGLCVVGRSGEGINVGGVWGGERDGQDYGSMVAQWIRCLTCNVEVEGSNPGCRTVCESVSLLKSF